MRMKWFAAILAALFFVINSSSGSAHAESLFKKIFSERFNPEKKTRNNKQPRVRPIVVLPAAVAIPEARPEEELGWIVPMLMTGEERGPPSGHVDFCQRYPQECGPTVSAIVILTDDLLALLRDVDRSVNWSVAPMSDQELYGVEERWDFPSKGAGDCDEVVLEKRRRLIMAGLPRSTLLLTYVLARTEDGVDVGPHLVLTIVTDQGDLILDNLRKLDSWYESPHQFIARESAFGGGRWEMIDDSSREPELFAAHFD